ncbi:MAG TPA: bifunctional diaminohydroxyphosphoribosylaminopyrimidine deaminase/5-amino-6-(5-phosphoribosylamino)uracil reductase RibD, partial [Flavobacterium sp.]
MNLHEKYMRRCIQLAKNGLGSTYPNPLVGSVVVYKDKIIGEGWHRKAGTPHAEVNAVNSVEDKLLLPESTLYVNLEPCNHFGKTPPCSEMIINSGIRNVVIGTKDHNSIVHGRGIQKLQDARINVISGILNTECFHVNKRFFTYHQKKRPYVILKWAETADGYIAPEFSGTLRTPVWITNQYSRQLVHKWRTEEQAILVGTNTVIADNPQLNVRDLKSSAVAETEQPVRIVIDRSAKIPTDSYVFNNQLKTIVICEQKIKRDEENIIFEIANFDGSLPLTMLE